MKQNASNGKQKKNRNATAAVMVLALGAAVYLNWSFALFVSAQSIFFISE